RALAFFFSSRRRHTRWPRDWSSDVCSSDLKTRSRGVGKELPNLGEIEFSRVRQVPSLRVDLLDKPFLARTRAPRDQVAALLEMICQRPPAFGAPEPQWRAGSDMKHDIARRRPLERREGRRRPVAAAEGGRRRAGN